MIIDYSFTIGLGPPYFRSGNYNIVSNFHLQNSDYLLFLAIYFEMTPHLISENGVEIMRETLLFDRVTKYLIQKYNCTQ